LYFRLAVIPIDVPPLRERLEDLPPLVEHFLAQLAKETGRRPPVFAPDALAALRQSAFPGNVRELRNLIERLVIMTPAPRLRAAEVAAATGVAAAPEPAPLARAGHALERGRLGAAVPAGSGAQKRAAGRLRPM